MPPPPPSLTFWPPVSKFPYTTKRWNDLTRNNKIMVIMFRKQLQSETIKLDNNSRDFVAQQNCVAKIKRKHPAPVAILATLLLHKTLPKVEQNSISRKDCRHENVATLVASKGCFTVLLLSQFHSSVSLVHTRTFSVASFSWKNMPEFYVTNEFAEKWRVSFYMAKKKCQFRMQKFVRVHNLLQKMCHILRGWQWLLRFCLLLSIVISGT